MILLSQAFLGIAMPLLNFVGNEIQDDPTEDDPGKTVIIHGVDDIFNEDDPNFKPSVTEEPGATEAPEEDDEPVTPGEITQSKLIKASDVKFKSGTLNFLLLGEHKEEGMFDTIFVLNVDTNKKVMKLYSIPRDTYVPYSQVTQEAMKKARFYYSPGSFKINASYYVGQNIIKYKGGKFGNSGIDYMCAIISQLLPGCNIDEYVLVDFEGFMDVIDIMGGIYCDVPEDIYNELGILWVKKGYQKLDAEAALHFVRYRVRRNSDGSNKGTGSDNYRKLNQANFITDLFEQVCTSEYMNYGTIIKMMDTLKTSVYHSISGSDVSTYLNIGIDFKDKKYALYPYVIDGDTIDPFGDNAYYVTLNN